MQTCLESRVLKWWKSVESCDHDNAITIMINYIILYSTFIGTFGNESGSIYQIILCQLHVPRLNFSRLCLTSRGDILRGETRVFFIWRNNMHGRNSLCNGLGSSLRLCPNLPEFSFLATTLLEAKCGLQLAACCGGHRFWRWSLRLLDESYFLRHREEPVVEHRYPRSLPPGANSNIDPQLKANCDKHARGQPLFVQAPMR